MVDSALVHWLIQRRDFLDDSAKIAEQKMMTVQEVVGVVFGAVVVVVGIINQNWFSKRRYINLTGQSCSYTLRR